MADRLDQGHWMVFHPDEVIATFFVPLQQAIGIPNGLPFPSYINLERPEIAILDECADDLYLLSLDSVDAPVTFTELGETTPTPDGPPVVNWSNKVALHSSIQFHQTNDVNVLRAGLDPAISVAIAAAGERTDPDTIRARAEALSGGKHGLTTADLRDLGVGPVTVAECAVGLRLTGTPPAIDGPLLPTGPDTPSQQVQCDGVDTDVRFHDRPTMWTWHKLDTHPDPRRVLERRIRNALNLAIHDLSNIERAVQRVRRLPLITSTVERLPPLLPVLLRPHALIGTDQTPDDLILLAPHANTLDWIEPDELTPDELDNVSYARQRQEEGGVFTTHVDLHRESTIALHRHGDYRLAALLSGMAAETLLDEVLLHTMWEQPLTPEQAAAAWTDGLDTRISREFQTRLGGNWNRKGLGPFGNWDRRVAELRNRVVHAGYTPTKEEATTSLKTLNKLVEFICDRLAADATRTRYPRTAVALAGTDGLARRNAYSGKAKQVATDPHEVNWHLTFINWREAWRRIRRDQNTTPRTPDLTNAHLLAVQHPDGTTHWCLHDRKQHLAAEATINTHKINPGFHQQTQDLANRIWANQPPEVHMPISMSYEAAIEATPATPWVEEYHHIPLAQVMVDRTDYTPDRRPS